MAINSTNYDFMIFDRWDPGIDRETQNRLGLQGIRQKNGIGMSLNQGKDLETRSFSDPRHLAWKKERNCKERSRQSCKDLLTLGRSVIIKTRSQILDGMCVDYIKSNFSYINDEILKELLDYIIEGFWQVKMWFSIWWSLQFLYFTIPSRDMIHKINLKDMLFIRMIFGLEIWFTGTSIKRKQNMSLSISLSTLLFITSYLKFHLFFLLRAQ